MPRDNSGNYTLPTGNPVVTGTIITTVWANPTMSDIAQALDDSLSRTGKGAMLAPLRAVDGSVSTPAYTFTNDVNSGMYLNAPNDVRISVGNIDKLRFINAGVEYYDEITDRWYPILSGESIGTNIETHELTAGQTEVPFTANVAGASLFVNGGGIDRGRLLEGDDYTYDAPTNTVTLLISPVAADTKLTALYLAGTDLDAAVTAAQESAAAAAAEADDAEQSAIDAAASAASVPREATIPEATAGDPVTAWMPPDLTHLAFKQFGLGRAAPDGVAFITNLNSISATGMYQFPSSATNAPEAAAGSVWQIIRNSLNLEQIALTITGGLFKRSKVNNVWEPWGKIIDDESVATPAEALAGTDVEHWMKPNLVHSAFNQYGLGTACSFFPDDDCNNISVTEFKRFTNTSLNAPAAVFGVILTVVYDQSALVWQYAMVGGTDSYKRRFTSGGWEPWRKDYSQNNILGTVSQSGGVPTGAIIERGSNANGTYIKYAGGLLISIVPIAVAGAINAGAVINYPIMSFPHAYNGGAPSITYSVSCSFPFEININSETGVSSTTFLASLKNTSVANVTDLYIDAVVIGYWY